MAEEKSISLQFVESMVSSIPVGIITVNTELRTAGINLAVEKIMGIKEERYLGSSFEALIKKVFSGEDSARLIEFVKRTFETGEKETIELASDKLKQKRIVRITASPLISSAEKIMGALIIFDDISDLKRLQQKEKELAAAQAKAGAEKKKADELQVIADAAIERELKIIELGKQVDCLLERFGAKPVYDEIIDDEARERMREILEGRNS